MVDIVFCRTKWCTKIAKQLSRIPNVRDFLYCLNVNLRILGKYFKHQVDKEVN